MLCAFIAYRGFESHPLLHVGTDFAPFRFFYAIKKSVTRSVVPPLSQKGTLGSPVRLQARSQRLTVATTFLRLRLRREYFNSLALLCRNGLCSVPIFLCNKKISHTLRRSSSFAKRHARLACSLASALSGGSQSLSPFCDCACGANISTVWHCCVGMDFAPFRFFYCIKKSVRTAVHNLLIIILIPKKGAAE